MKSITDNRNLLGLMRTVKLYCKYRPLGCEEISNFDQFEEHAKECGKCKVCDKDGIIKKEMYNHHIDTCEKFMFRCQFCSIEGTRNHLSEHH